MSFLTVNGIDTKAFLEGVTKTRDVVGVGITRAQDGSARNNFNAKKWHVKGKTIPLSQADALFLQAMLDGKGDHWTFDADTYSDKGASWSGAPTLPTGVTLVTATPTPKRGAKCLQIDANASHSIVFPLEPLADGWTFAVWFSLAAATFDRWIVTGSGTVASGGAVTAAYKNGVAQSAVMPAWAAVDASANTLTLKGQAGGTDSFDDLVVIPEPLPSDLLSSLDTFYNSQAWPTPYPIVQCGGDFHPVALNMLGQPGDGAQGVGSINGAAYADNLVELAFDFFEA